MAKKKEEAKPITYEDLTKRMDEIQVSMAIAGDKGDVESLRQLLRQWDITKDNMATARTLMYLNEAEKNLKKVDEEAESDAASE